MTYSDCWIDTVDDADFKTFIAARSSMDVRRADKIHILPPSPRSYSINRVKEWVAAHHLPVADSGTVEVRMPASRTQIPTPFSGRNKACVR